MWNNNNTVLEWECLHVIKASSSSIKMSPRLKNKSKNKFGTSPKKSRNEVI